MPTAMPTSSNEVLLPIQESLKSSLAKSAPNLDQRLVSSSKQILMHKIQFRPAEKASHSYQLDSLRAKYTPLNAGSGKCSSPEVVEGYKTPESIKMIGESLPAPKVVLFPPEKITLEWPKVRPAGAGLVNLGNTCFLNSTLQCLTYTAPLVNFLRNEDHCNTCKVAGFCMLCELHRHTRRCMEQQGSIKPLSIVHKLRVIAKHMHLGRQEDAHEFLRYVIDHMQKACLYGFSKLDNFSKETTAINQIFGGYLRSQVVCLRCNSRSNTYDPFLDISLDIKNVPSVEKALERYIHPERLDSDNAYNCTKCKQKVPAQKRFTIHKAPNVLTIQLKRFDCSRPSAKVTRHVHFPEKLDLRPYMSNKVESSVAYQLYAVLVHSGYSCNSGHYYCFVKAPNRIWHCMNDQHVGQIGVNRVLSAEAYLLFYKRVNTMQQVQNKGPIIGPQLPKASTTITPTVEKLIHTLDKPCTNVGTPVQRKPFVKTSTIVNESQSSTPTPDRPAAPLVMPSTIPMPSQREKISFGIKPKDKEDNKPRLVMRIKHGTVCYNSSVEDRKGVGDNNGSTKVIQRLVPYNGESDSEDEDGESQKSKGDGHLTNGGNVAGKGKTPVVNGSSPKGFSKASFEPVIDERLTTTTTVPGAYGPLDKAAAWSPSKKARSMLSKDDSHSYQPVNKAKPLKRSFSDDGLTIDTSPLKLNATTHWNILGTDAQVSPSIASGSSTCSINSTTEWHVHNKLKPKGQLVPVAQHVGWKVTPQKQPKCESEENLCGSQDTVTDSTHITKQASSTSLPLDTHKSEDLEQNLKMKMSISDSDLTSHKNKKKSGLSRFLCLGGATDSPKDKEPLLREKPYDLSVYDFHDEDSSTNVPLHRSRSQAETEQQEQAAKSGIQVKAETDSTIDNVLSKLMKKHKKHKKHKKKHKKQHGEYEELLGSSVTDTDASTQNKKKKKKHKKRKYEDDEEDEEVARKKMNIETEEDTSNDQEYTWVEKSKDASNMETPTHPTVHVQQWDQHIKDPQKRPAAAVDSEGSTSGTTTTKPATKASIWDGSRNSNSADVISELLKSNSHGYGSNVLSWDGNRTTLDEEAALEKKNSHKRHWSDDYEEELDRGKVKKVKHGAENGDTNGHGNSYNVFQNYQDSRNSDTEKRKSGFISPDRDHRHRDYDVNGNHHKSGHHGYHDRNHSHHRDGYHRNGRDGYYNKAYHHDRH